MQKTIEIVDRGRGPQLSTSRITVQDLVPYLDRQCTYQEILELMPVLTIEEIKVVERYVQDHLAEVMEQDRLIRERNAQRTNPPIAEVVLRRGGEKMEALRKEFQRRKLPERNGDHTSC